MANKLDWLNQHPIWFLYPTVAQVVQNNHLQLATPQQKLAERFPIAEDYLKALWTDGQFKDCCLFCAYNTSPRVAVWWSYLCVIDLYKELLIKPSEEIDLASIAKPRGFNYPEWTKLPDDGANDPQLQLVKEQLKNLTGQLNASVEKLKATVPSSIINTFNTSLETAFATIKSKCGVDPRDLLEECFKKMEQAQHTPFIDEANSPIFKSINELQDKIEKMRVETVDLIKGAMPQADPEKDAKLSKQCMETVWEYISAPNENNAQALMQLGNSCPNKVEGLLSYVAFWSYGSLSPKAEQVIKTPDGLMANGINGLLTKCATSVGGIYKPNERYERYFNLAFAALTNQSSWESYVERNSSPYQEVQKEIVEFLQLHPEYLPKQPAADASYPDTAQPNAAHSNVTHTAQAYGQSLAGGAAISSFAQTQRAAQASANETQTKTPNLQSTFSKPRFNPASTPAPHPAANSAMPPANYASTVGDFALGAMAGAHGMGTPNGLGLPKSMADPNGLGSPDGLFTAYGMSTPDSKAMQSSLASLESLNTPQDPNALQDPHALQNQAGQIGQPNQANQPSLATPQLKSSFESPATPQLQTSFETPTTPKLQSTFETTVDPQDLVLAQASTQAAPFANQSSLLAEPSSQFADPAMPFANTDAPFANLDGHLASPATMPNGQNQDAWQMDFSENAANHIPEQAIQSGQAEMLGGSQLIGQSELTGQLGQQGQPSPQGQIAPNTPKLQTTFENSAPPNLQTTFANLSSTPETGAVASPVSSLQPNAHTSYTPQVSKEQLAPLDAMTRSNMAQPYALRMEYTTHAANAVAAAKLEQKISSLQGQERVDAVVAAKSEAAQEMQNRLSKIRAGLNRRFRG